MASFNQSPKRYYCSAESCRSEIAKDDVFCGQCKEMTKYPTVLGVLKFVKEYGLKAYETNFPSGYTGNKEAPRWVNGWAAWLGSKSGSCSFFVSVEELEGLADACRKNGKDGIRVKVNPAQAGNPKGPKYQMPFMFSKRFEFNGFGGAQNGSAFSPKAKEPVQFQGAGNIDPEAEAEVFKQRISEASENLESNKFREFK